MGATSQCDCPAEAQTPCAPPDAPGVWSKYAARRPKLHEQSGHPRLGHAAMSASDQALDPFAPGPAKRPDPIDIDELAAPATRAPTAVCRPSAATPATARPRAPKPGPGTWATGSPAAAPPRVPRQRPSTPAVGGDHETIDVAQMDPQAEHQSPPPPPNMRPPSPPHAIHALSPPPPPSVPPAPHYTEDSTARPVIPDLPPPPPPYSEESES